MGACISHDISQLDIESVTVEEDVPTKRLDAMPPKDSGFCLLDVHVNEPSPFKHIPVDLAKKDVVLFVEKPHGDSPLGEMQESDMGDADQDEEGDGNDSSASSTSNLSDHGPDYSQHLDTEGHFRSRKPRKLLAAGVMGIVTGLKGLKESVVEIIRISGVELSLPTLSDEFVYALDIEVVGPKHPCSKQVIYGHMDGLPLFRDQQNDNILRTHGCSFQCKALRSSRRRGHLYVNLLLTSAATTRSRHVGWSFSSARTWPDFVFGEVARFRAPLPLWSFLGSSGIALTLGAANGVESTAIAQVSLLDGSTIFDVRRCRPHKFVMFGDNEWHPRDQKQWEHCWSLGKATPPGGMANAMVHDMKNAAVLMFQTMFCQNLHNPPHIPQMDAEEVELHDRRVLFLKRLFVCFAVCKVMYSVEENGATWRNWDYPLASVLSHGGRVLIRLDGVKWQNFLNFLLFGAVDHHNWQNGPPAPLHARPAASHDITLESRSARLLEKRLAKMDLHRNISTGLLGRHLGMNLPYGGLGNPTPKLPFGPTFVGPSGVPFRRLDHSHVPATYLTRFQQGHMYIRWEDFGLTQVPVLSKHELSPSLGERETICRTITDMHQDSARRIVTDGSSFDSAWMFTADSTGRLGTECSGWTHPSRQESPLRTLTHSNISASTKFLSELSKPEAQEVASATLPEPPASNRNVGKRWLTLPDVTNIKNLKEVLKLHKYNGVANDNEQLERLHRLITEEKEFALQATEKGELRCRCVLIHLVLERISVGVAEVLVHKAVAVDTQHYEDLRVPMIVRRRTEPWSEAMLRLCQTQLHLSQQATDHVIARCRAQDDISMYECQASPVLCRHHGRFGDNLEVDYQACRLEVRVAVEDQHLFWPVEETKFRTVDVVGWGKREWVFMNREEAQFLNVPGLTPPLDRLHVVREECHLGAVLLGIEGCAPLKQTCFGAKHGVGAKSNELSVSGKQKWRAYREAGHEVPADIGGLHMVVDTNTFKNMMDVCDVVVNTKPSDGVLDSAEFRSEKRFFKMILRSSEKVHYPNRMSSVDAALRNYLNFHRPLFHAHGGTCMLDSSVRDRVNSASKPLLRLASSSDGRRTLPARSLRFLSPSSPRSEDNS